MREESDSRVIGNSGSGGSTHACGGRQPSTAHAWRLSGPARAMSARAPSAGRVGAAWVRAVAHLPVQLASGAHDTPPPAGRHLPSARTAMRRGRASSEARAACRQRPGMNRICAEKPKDGTTMVRVQGGPAGNLKRLDRQRLAVPREKRSARAPVGPIIQVELGTLATSVYAR